MKVSIITATLNSEKTLLNNINSVKKQTYKNIEQIFVDGLSKDKSLEIIKKHSLNKSKLISEKDKGIYDAMNKGINISKGEIIFILNSDDIFFNKNVVKLIVDIFKKNKKIGIVFGNLIIKKKNKIYRKWIPGHYKYGSFVEGWSPPHPAFVVRKNIYKRYGIFDIGFKNASDIELMYRFIEKFKINNIYLNKWFVIMKHGGASSGSLKNIIEQNFQNFKIFKKNKKFNIFIFIFKKFLNRIKQFYG